MLLKLSFGSIANDLCIRIFTKLWYVSDFKMTMFVIEFDTHRVTNVCSATV